MLIVIHIVPTGQVLENAWRIQTTCSLTARRVAKNAERVASTAERVASNVKRVASNAERHAFELKLFYR